MFTAVLSGECSLVAMAVSALHLFDPLTLTFNLMTSRTIHLPSSVMTCPLSSGFYPRDAMLARVFATVTCLSICLDICLSHAGIVPSRAKAGS